MACPALTVRTRQSRTRPWVLLSLVAVFMIPLQPPAPHQAVAGAPSSGDPKPDPLLDSITDGMVSVDRHWRVTYVNAVTERLAGRSRESLLGKELWSELPELRQTPFA